MVLIVPYIDISMFYINYLTMHKMQMHADAIRKLLNGVCICTGDNLRALASGLSSCRCTYHNLHICHM